MTNNNIFNGLKVLVTDANNRITLAIIRALGRTGAKITAVEQEPFALKTPIGFYSKYVSNTFIIPSLETEDKCLIKLLAYAKGHDIILPVSINMVLAVVKNRAIFEKEGIAVPYANIDKIKTANNKSKLLDLAQKFGVPIPKTQRLSSTSELSRLKNELLFPIVIKITNDEGLYLPPEKRYAIVRKPEHLEKTYQEIHQIKEFPLIQEYIEGDGYGFSALLDKNSEVKAIFCHKRIREYPPSGGPSVLCESIYDPVLVESGIKLLRAINWQGIAMVEFKKDKRDNTYKLMEINPRFWGSLPLAIFSGVNFPYLLCQCVSGKILQPVLKYQVGVKVRFTLLDLISLYGRLKKGNIKSAHDFITNFFDTNIKEGLLDWSDPRPFFRYLINHL
ncbi:MAG: ATP-grasp domain-containing protein [Planctomycetota bacterium]